MDRTISEDERNGFFDLKMKRVWQRHYANPAEAIADITHSIVGFYNTHRRHSTLGYRSPTNYEKATVGNHLFR